MRVLGEIGVDEREDVGFGVWWGDTCGMRTAHEDLCAETRSWSGFWRSQRTLLRGIGD